MSYEKLGFTSGQTLKAEHLNYIEEGIANAGGVTSWNDLEDKPFYSEMVEVSATFDGDLTNKEYADMGQYKLVKMYDKPLTKEDLIGATLTYTGTLNPTTMGSVSEYITEVDLTEDMVIEQSLSDTVGAIQVGVGQFAMIWVIYGDISESGLPLTEGTYFYFLPDYNGGYIYTKSLSCLNGVRELVHKIDAKYLPEVGLKADEVQTMIDSAIGNAIGGSY